jgi:hypothetical protein
MKLAELSTTSSEAAAVLSKATQRAATFLGLSNAELAVVLGVSTSSVDRLVAGTRSIDPASKEGQLAAMLIRIFRSLDALLGDSLRILNGCVRTPQRSMAKQSI